jgi:hypothetical protein
MFRLARAAPQTAFGGVQMLMFGDIFQLEPVVASSAEGEYFSTIYRGPFFFNAHVFERTRFRVIDLRKVFRQKDPGFVELLDSVRMNHVTNDQLDRLNQACRPSFVPGQPQVVQERLDLAPLEEGLLAVHPEGDLAGQELRLQVVELRVEPRQHGDLFRQDAIDPGKGEHFLRQRLGGRKAAIVDLHLI